MNRRDALKGLAALPFVSQATPVTQETKAIILTIRQDFDCDPESAQTLKDAVRKTLTDAGCSHVQVLLLRGIECHTIQ